MGSVKDLVTVEHPSPYGMGTGDFVFSNRYSVFDWGEMPDHIDDKGASLCMTSAYFFEQLERKGVKTHYIGVRIDDDNYAAIFLAKRPQNVMRTHLVNVVVPELKPDGTYDYSAFQSLDGNFVIPLEIIYRNTLPKGSSVFRRLADGRLSVETLGLEEQPQEGIRLPRPFIDVSTKYEAFDRYPDQRMTESRRSFFRDLAYLTNSQIDELEHNVQVANEVVTDCVAQAGLQNDDGKFEFGFTPGKESIMFLDAVGTLDECRFTYPLNGQRVEVSKEIPRQWYKYNQPEWVAEIDAAKKQHGSDWREHVKTRPEPLPHALGEILSDVYRSAANAVIGKDVFDAPNLDEVVAEYQRFARVEMK